MAEDGLPNLSLIAIAEPGQNLREAIQQMVRQHAEHWWHQMPDVWIVEGGNPSVWRDRIMPLRTAAGHQGLLVVLKLPEATGDRSWAGIGGTKDNQELAWLHKPYFAAAQEEDDDIPF